jgi:hypothetical protein
MARRTFAPLLVAAALLVPAATPLSAQDRAVQSTEDDLRRHFEGRTVTLKLDMPATEKGVDVHPRRERPLDYPAYASRLKEYGTAIRSGERSIVTKVKLKGKHIEFQLGGGGYGTFGDPGADVSAPTTPKTKREEELDKLIGRTSNRAERRRLERERDELRKEREAEDVRLRAASADAQERRREQVRSTALESGSRFNIRFDEQVPSAALTPEAIESALAKYVDFGDDADRPRRRDRDEEAVPTGVAALRKGLLAEQLDELLGKPLRTHERNEGRLRVVTRVYEPKGESVRVEAELVEGVLFRYAVSSR